MLQSLPTHLNSSAELVTRIGFMDIPSSSMVSLDPASIGLFGSTGAIDLMNVVGQDG